ncbi:cell division protein DivIB [Paenibacillus sp. Root52]|uniref:Cell division protein DivIB n=1 Tax=Paenibacillus amylolyticus TaxID=1451 RepID=A0AAP5H327_PAEAM|nr:MULTISPECIES: FtsQ-type POTRA domain-containing protein [Paenibacillus]KQY87465.1 cell division protein DivIB [Paenibacillus sp. Root52]MDR6725394.1 cell division protein FtsQ [Paenibacillus amylolyticus]
MPKSQIPVLKKNRPKRNTSRKIVFILLLLFVALLAVLFFRSSMSRISEIEITGNVYTSTSELLEKSGLKVGEQFFGTSSSEIIEQLKTDKAISNVTVDKQFPGTIHIKVEEYSTVAYELAADGALKAILASGTSLIVPPNIGVAVEKPILTQWKTDDPLKAKLSEVLATIPNELTTDISEIIPNPTPSFPDQIRIYTKSQFEVITTVSMLPDKVEYLNQVIETERPGKITMLEADTYVPFIADNPEDDVEPGASP